MKKILILIPLFLIASCGTKTTAVKPKPKPKVKTAIKVKGCTDKTAANYDSEADIEDGSCYYEYITINDFVSAEKIPYLFGANPILPLKYSWFPMCSFSCR